MDRRLRFLGVAAIAGALLAGTQLAGVGPAHADFVCPVLPVSDQGKEHSQAFFIDIAGGDTSILPGKAGDPAVSPVNVPDTATNSDGAGSPGGAHSVPGDAGYTAIWNTPL